MKIKIIVIKKYYYSSVLIIIAAKTSVRPTIEPEDLVFTFLSVCVLRDSGRRNYPIRLKLDTNIYVLCEISCIICGVHCLNSACTGIRKSISIYYDLWRKILVSAF